MDVQRAIEHLLELHARSEIRHERGEARLDKLEKQTAAILKIIRVGAKEIFKAQKENAREIKALTADIRRLEKAWFRPGGNGPPPRQ